MHFDWPLVIIGQLCFNKARKMSYWLLFCCSDRLPLLKATKREKSFTVTSSSRGETIHHYGKHAAEIWSQPGSQEAEWVLIFYLHKLSRKRVSWKCYHAKISLAHDQGSTSKRILNSSQLTPPAGDQVDNGGHFILNHKIYR